MKKWESPCSQLSAAPFYTCRQNLAGKNSTFLYQEKSKCMQTESTIFYFCFYLHTNVLFREKRLHYNGAANLITNRLYPPWNLTHLPYPLWLIHPLSEFQKEQLHSKTFSEPAVLPPHACLPPQPPNSLKPLFS